MEMKERQQIQYEHDMKNHFDILSLSRLDRLKHYGLHFAKYAGRFARGREEIKSRNDTLVDAFLVALSTANALNQKLPEEVALIGDIPSELAFTDYAGRFADACEKIDHLEEFRSIALDANAAIMDWILRSGMAQGVDLDTLAEERRKQLSRRAVYAPGS
ncbi:MAG: hypothetical protein HLUCCA13_08660 [Halomonas sp. HL-48]|nr:hypothetical protein [Halomonas sp. HL-48]KPQ24577.1 MAG: hypothetical protein HLUCCA13_08660 [Halomonas sp. HL-48]